MVIDVKTHPAIGHHDDHGRDLARSDALVGNAVGLAKLQPPRIVVGIAVEQIDHRIVAVGGFVVGGEINRVANRFAQDFTFHFQSFHHLAFWLRKAHKSHTANKEHQ